MTGTRTCGHPPSKDSAVSVSQRIRRLSNKIYNEKNADAKVHLAAAFALVSEGKMDTSDFSPLRYLMENLELRGQRDSAQAYLTELCRRDDVRKALFPLLREATKDQKMALCQALSASRKR